MSREQAKAIIEKLVERFAEHRKDYHLADYNEQKARQDFINPFFKALGWDIDNEKGDSEAYREVIYEDKVVVNLEKLPIKKNDFKIKKENWLMSKSLNTLIYF